MARRTKKRAAPRRYKDKYPSGRDKGFAEYNPRVRKKLVAEVLEIHDRYAGFKMHPRGYFYRLIGEHGYAKTGSLWGKVKDVLVKMRRGRLIPFDDVSDRKARTFRPPLSYSGLDEFWQTVRDDAAVYRRDRDAGPFCKIEIITESAGTIDIMKPVADEYGITVYTSSGFNGVNMMHAAAERAVTRMMPTVILHLGDLDSSGESMYDAMAEDIRLFAEGLADEWYYDRPEITFVRVALTREQAEELDLPTSPASKGDRRGGFDGDTVQLESVSPPQLVEILKRAILEHFDEDIWDEVLEIEEEELPKLAEQVRRYLPDDE
jgi:hypothetical protein